MAHTALKLKFRLIIFILTCMAILAADLIITMVNRWVLSYKGTLDKHYVTLIGMAAVLAVFYLFATYITKMAEKLVNIFVSVTRRIAGRVIGLYLAITVLGVMLFAGYYLAWFERNFFAEIFSFARGLIR